jgi:DNA primase
MAGLIPPAVLEQIRAANDIVEVIGGYFPLKRSGSNFSALCPFHKEKSPSFSVNAQKQIFYCFGCHKGGDVFTFVKEYENLTFMDAVRRLAERAKIPLEFEAGGGRRENREVKDILYQIHEQITLRWHQVLLNDSAGQHARDYLADRGVSAEAVKIFRLGCAPDKWDDTVNWARGKNFDLATVETGGLILRRESGEGHYDRFRGRLMFPICDDTGRVIGFSGRVLSGDEKTAKYVNSPETPIFTKGKVIFGLDKSKRALLESQTAIICEGQLDLIACYMAGVRNVVAPQGTALTSDHARILKRYVDEVVLCFDADAAGQNATVRSLDSLLASGLAVRVATVPPPHDPDSYIKASGGEAFQQIIAGARSFFDYYLDRLCSMNDRGTDKGRMVVLRSMAEAVLKTGNAVLVDTYAQKTAAVLGVSPDSARTEFRRIQQQARRPVEPASSEPVPAAETEAEPLPSPSQQEFWLVRFLLQSDDFVERVAERLEEDWLVHPHVRQIVHTRIQAHLRKESLGLPALLTSLEHEGARRLAHEAVFQDRTVLNQAQQIEDILVRLRNQHLERQMADLSRQLHQSGATEEQQNAILRRQQELRAAKKAPLPAP